MIMFQRNDAGAAVPLFHRMIVCRPQAQRRSRIVRSPLFIAEDLPASKPRDRAATGSGPPDVRGVEQHSASARARYSGV